RLHLQSRRLTLRRGRLRFVRWRESRMDFARRLHRELRRAKREAKGDPVCALAVSGDDGREVAVEAWIFERTGWLCSVALSLGYALDRCRRIGLRSRLPPIAANLHVVEQSTLGRRQHVLPPRLPRVALRSVDEPAVVIRVDGLAAGGVGVVAGAAVDLEGTVQSLDTFHVGHGKKAITVGVPLHHASIALRPKLFGRRPECNVRSRGRGIVVPGEMHLDRALGHASKVKHRVTIHIVALDPTPSHLLVPSGGRDPASLEVAVAQGSVAIASSLMGVLGGRLGARATREEDPAFPVSGPRQNHDLIVVESRASPALPGGGKDGCLTAQRQQYTVPVTMQVVAGGVVAAHLYDAGVDGVFLRVGQPDKFIG